MKGKQNKDHSFLATYLNCILKSRDKIEFPEFWQFFPKVIELVTKLFLW
jgi:hypothetical protein